MIVRVEGIVDGNPVIFSREEGDRWSVAVPPDLDGTYIVELTAYNDAGNVGFTTKILCTFHPENRIVRIQPFPWACELLPERYRAELITGKAR